MKKVLLTLALCLVAIQTSAQEFRAYIDLEKRYDLVRHPAVDSSAWITVRFTNVCPGDDHPAAVTMGYRQVPCHQAARGEVVSLPEHASVVVGTPMSEIVDGRTIRFVIADSLRMVVMKVPSGTYELRGGHLRTYRIEVPPFQMQPGDSVVVEMAKTFLSIPGCQSGRVVLSPPDLRAEYLSRRQDFLYFRDPRGHVTATCYRDVHDYLYKLPASYR